ncbi:MAG: D-glycerate dehydrogenase [Fibrobacteres bacterium]|nr:D-glycerate dehydrogenase [Fibrobacterota bacterium]
MIKIAVTEPEYKKAIAVFENSQKNDMLCLPAPTIEDELVDFIARHNIRHVILGVSPYREKLYGVLSKGAVIARFGVGYDGLNIPLAAKKGLFCTNTPGALTNSVAEHAMAFILAAARFVPQMDTNLRKGIWKPIVGNSLKGKQLTIIGTGQIGQRLAEIAAKGFGMHVTGVYNSEKQVNNVLLQKGFMKLTSTVSEGVQDADFVSLHLPLNDTTNGFVNEKFLNIMPDKAWLMNTARGGIVDEKQLFNALAKNKIAGAALDVFQKEPYEPYEPECDFRTLNNVILTPHIGSTTREACERMAKICLKNIEHAENGNIDKMNLIRS